MSLRSVLLLCLLCAAYSQCPTIDYSQGGANWQGLCSTGTMQSPINLEESVNMTVFSHYLFLNYPTMKVKQTENCEDQYSITVDDTWEMIVKDNTTQSLAYTATEVYWHSPSEHLLAGVPLNLELQISHTLFAGSSPFTTAILAILFVSDNDPQPNPLFQQVINSADGSLLDSVPQFSLSGTISKMTAFAPYFYYQGSLTTPPCTELVSWYVLATPQRISASQLKAFTSKWSGNKAFAGGNGNNREPQALGDRVLYVNSASNREQLLS